MHSKHLQITTPSSRSLSLSLTYFEHLQQISLSLSLYIYIYTSSNNDAPHSPLAPSPSFSNILHALTAHLSLSLCTPSTLQMTTPLLSLPQALSNIFEHLQHVSLSLSLYIYIYIYFKQ